jgi:hypothetical protein
VGPLQHDPVRGYQAAGTRGSVLIGGSRDLRIHGETVAIEAEVAVLDGLSAHADYPEILDWLGGFEAGPRRTFIVHGEPAAAEALRNRIRGRLRWECEVRFRQKAGSASRILAKGPSAARRRWVRRRRRISPARHVWRRRGWAFQR